MAWKRKLIWLLALLTLLALPGCRRSKVLIPSLGEVYTDYPGVELRIEAVEQKEGALTLKTRWHNTTNQEAMYGAAYSIEREEDGQWIPCETKRDDISFIAIGYLLPSRSGQEKDYTVSNIYDITKPGTYRIRTDCWVNETKVTLWAAFTLEETNAAGTQSTGLSQPEAVSWQAQYIRTNGGNQDTVFPGAAVIADVQALQEYYGQNRDVFDLERREKVYGDSTVGFLDACDKYTEEFFAEHYLIFVLAEKGSGSIRHKVTSVERTGTGELQIDIESIVPEVCTDDMAQWHIILEIERQGEVPQAEDILLPISPDCTEPAAGTVYAKPPVLTVVGSDGNTQAELSTYSWFYTDENGKGNGICVDALPPLYCREFVTPFYTSGEVKLLFEEQPDSVSVRCWSDKYWNSSNAKEEKVTLEGGVLLKLNPGGYIYEVRADWSREHRSYGGDVLYYFYAVQQTDVTAGKE